MLYVDIRPELSCLLALARALAAAEGRPRVLDAGERPARGAVPDEGELLADGATEVLEDGATIEPVEGDFDLSGAYGGEEIYLDAC